MEEVIQIVIFLVIVASVVIRKAKEVNKNRPGQAVKKTDLKEDFINPEEEEEIMKELEEEMGDFDFPIPSDNPFEKKEQVSPVNRETTESEGEHKKEVYQPIDNPVYNQEGMFQSPIKPAFVAHTNDSKKHHTKDSRITLSHKSETLQISTKTTKEPAVRIKTRSEARKAFIYSEIFNRKYE